MRSNPFKRARKPRRRAKKANSDSASRHVEPQLKGSEVRLNKFLADCGVSSRRKADELIESGLVKVNGKQVFELGRKIDPQMDQVVVDGKKIGKMDQKIYIMLNKPQGVLSTMNDPKGRPTVAELIEKIPYRLFPVGRLDWDSEGLLLMTNDGDFSQKVTHPKEKIPKTYLVKVDGQPTPDHLNKLLNGVSIIGGRVKAQEIEKIRSKKKSSKYDWIRITITEGKYRQIRQMFAKIGFDVMKLQRVSIGELRLGNLNRGEFVFLTPLSIQKIFRTRPVRSKATSKFRD